ncbi:MAG: protein translocase subunit SecF, partial [Nanoarchaeota archaeon]
RLSSVIIEASDITEKDIVASLQAAGISLAEGSYSVENIGASIGTDFFRQTLYAVIGAFLGIALVVYITFRSFVPSAFAVQAVVSTMIMTLATINLLGVRLSTGGIAAFLMLIGYSIDTDILLTSRVLKNREGDIFQRILGATKTGLTMTLTAAAATTVGFLFTQSDTIKQIMLILTIGLVYDIINTWCNNASVLRWYLEKKGGRNG